MSKIMYFSATGAQPTPDAPYPSQLVGAKLSNTAGATLVKIYDGTSTSGELLWELNSPAASTPDYDSMTPDGVVFSSGNIYVDFISGTGEVFLNVK